MTQPLVFIAYSQQDEADKERLMTHLGVLQRAGLVELWNDDQIGAGADWMAAMDQAMSQARIAMLLITANFLTTDFILDSAIPNLLERRRQKGLVIFPIIARPCAWKRVDWLRRMRVRPKNERPVWGEGGSHVDEDLAAIADEIAYIIEQLTGETRPTGGAGPQLPVNPQEGKQMGLVEGFAIPVVLKAVEFLFGVAKEVMEQRRTLREKGHNDLPPPPAIPLLEQDQQVLLRKQVSEQGVEQKKKRLSSLLEELELYEKNRQFLSKQAGQYGGREFAPLFLFNQLTAQEDAIMKLSEELARLVDDLTGRKS